MPLIFLVSLYILAALSAMVSLALSFNRPKAFRAFIPSMVIFGALQIYFILLVGDGWRHH